MKSWWQPQLRIGDETEAEQRRATWMELFYDLVYVVAVAQLAHNLYENTSITGFIRFIALFIPVWWSWIGTTLYANRFDTDDIGHRLLTGVQILAIAALAVNIHYGLGKTSVGFALAYAASRFVLVVEYARAAKHIPVARPLASYYAKGFAIAAGLWFISAFIPVPWRFVLWGIAMIIDFATPLTASQLQMGLIPHPEHLPERFGLFTIIVLGEAIVAVVDGVAEQQWEVKSAIAAVFGFAIAFTLWWMYFENIGSSAILAVRNEGNIRTFNTWLYTHLPLVIGIVTTGVAVEQVLLGDPNVALPTAERWLLCVGVILCLFALGILHRTGVIKHCKVRSGYRIGAASVVLLVGIVGEGWLPVVEIGIIAVVCISQVIQDLYQSRAFAALNT
ncbi:low temperature requirement protein A [cyanobacterium TDX16]|nr:low temperature requirement protein A [cyanobacterium TDX16]